MSSELSRLDAHGLNLQAVFDLEALPAPIAEDLYRRFDPDRRYRQLILVGHGGRALWAAIRAAGFDSLNPVDDFSVAVVNDWFDADLAGHARRIIYPGAAHVPLQALGRLAGWHHDSPLALGINARFGTWFAYRVALLADTDLPPSPAWTEPSPCAACVDRPCIAQCPADALAGGVFALDRCVRQRLAPESGCRASCSARQACPVGAEHRYDPEQMRHHYLASLRTLQKSH